MSDEALEAKLKRLKEEARARGKPKRGRGKKKNKKEEPDGKVKQVERKAGLIEKKDAPRVRQKGPGVKCPACGGDMFVERSVLDPRYPRHIAADLPRLRYLKCSGCGHNMKQLARSI